ncbi:competence type IV pilus minor pilin ComGF [Hutsoniella sourekii]|uniref:competence type IV pilus minor pilin ComGF n=1 Tax=Hutsoniella sourekii TaxID=87650 RepID=UPI00047F71D5|nr:prepilin-type N-terminal cleavage/methylation domain-containing protein [Hutsoniella sourekii]
MKLNKRGFTLMELLIALLVLALVMQSLLMCLRSYQLIDQSHRQDQSHQWQLFLNLMEKELTYFEDFNWRGGVLWASRREGNRLQQVRFFVRNGRIDRAPGTVIYLYDVRSWWGQRVGDFLYIEVEMTNGQVFDGWLPLKEGSS